MGRLALAFRLFFQILSNKTVAEQAKRLEVAAPSDAPKVAPPAPTPPRSAPTPVAPAITRGDALTLLELLQREARFLDFIQEDLDGYSDEQVGAAAREVHRQSRQVLQRAFRLGPVLDVAEGAAYTVSAGDDAARIRLVGRVTDARPVQGELVHPGWRAAQCELPRWSGGDAAASILAPAEVELR